MTKSNFRSAAVAILALGAGFSASAAFAQDRSVGWADEGAAAVGPAGDEAAAAVPPNVAGHYTCSSNEVHYRLERKNCGGLHYQD